MRYEPKQAIAIIGEALIPKSSRANNTEAMGVLVAPAKTATRPIPANNDCGKGINQISTLPKVAPIKNNGVTSPPLKPKPMQKVVSKSLIKKSFACIGTINESEMLGNPKPINSLQSKNEYKRINASPAINGRKKLIFMYELRLAKNSEKLVNK